MNKTHIIRTLLTVSLLAANSLLFAQSEMGVILNVTTEKKFNSRLEGELSVDSRFQDIVNEGYFERLALGAGLGYKIVDTKKFDLKANIGLEYLRQVKPQQEEYTKKENLKITHKRKFNRTRTSLGFAAAYKPTKRWSFSLKETVQYNHYACHEANVLKFDRKFKDGEYFYNYDANAPWMDNLDAADDCEMKKIASKDRFVLRNKITIKYDIRHSILSPYASADYGCGLNYTTNKWKLTAGTEIKLSKLHNLDVFYRFQTEDDDDEPNGHLLGVSYILKF